MECECWKNCKMYFGNALAKSEYLSCVFAEKMRKFD